MTIDVGSDAPMGIPNEALDALIDSGLKNLRIVDALKFRRFTRGALDVRVVAAADIAGLLPSLLAAGSRVDVIALKYIDVDVHVVKGIVSVDGEGGNRVLMRCADKSGLSVFSDEELVVILWA